MTLNKQYLRRCPDPDFLSILEMPRELDNLIKSRLNPVNTRKIFICSTPHLRDSKIFENLLSTKIKQSHIQKDECKMWIGEVLNG